MFTTMLFAAVATLSLASGPSGSAVYVQENSAHVRYGDLNLLFNSDRERLVARIEHAARLLCEVPGPAPVLPHSSETECLRLAAADGMAQMARIAPRTKE